MIGMVSYKHNFVIFSLFFVQKIDKDVRKEVDDAVTKTKQAKEPSPEELTYDLYVKSIEPNIRGVAYYERKPHKNTRTPENVK